MSTLCVPHFYHSCYSKHLLKSYMAKQTAIIMGCIKRLDNYRTISKEGILWGKVGGNNSGNWRAWASKELQYIFCCCFRTSWVSKIEGRKQKGPYYYEYCFMVQVVCVGSIFCFLEKNFNLHPWWFSILFLTWQKDLFKECCLPNNTLWGDSTFQSVKYLFLIHPHQMLLRDLSGT